MRKFTKPNFKLLTADESENYAKYLVRPLERGFGRTIGNAIRRTLLSSTPGAAVFAYRIPGETHEYTTVEGILETLVEVSLNLKGLILKIDAEIIPDDETVTLHLKKAKQGAVTAADIVLPSGVEVINPEHVLMHLAPKKRLEMEIYAKQSRGYYSFEDNKVERFSPDLIIIDSNYSGMQKVAYHVRPVQAVKKQNYEELTLEVQTNGSISPDDAVACASQILTSHLAFFMDLSTHYQEVDLIAPEEEDYNDDLDRSIYDLELTQRSEKCLIKQGINTLRELIQHSEKEIEAIPNLGRVSLREIKNKLYQLDLDFKKG